MHSEERDTMVFPRHEEHQCLSLSLCIPGMVVPGTLRISSTVLLRVDCPITATLIGAANPQLPVVDIMTAGGVTIGAG